MALVTFVNDSAPYLNAENLNNNFEYLDDKIEEVYSTSEIKTNKVWIDGKPIYRKVVELTASTTTQSFAVSTISSNINEIWIDSSASFYGNGGVISDWQIETGRFRVTIDGGNVYYICTTNAYKNGKITFNYTKTTD